MVEGKVWDGIGKLTEAGHMLISLSQSVSRAVFQLSVPAGYGGLPLVSLSSVFICHKPASFFFFLFKIYRAHEATLRRNPKKKKKEIGKNNESKVETISYRSLVSQRLVLG